MDAVARTNVVLGLSEIPRRSPILEDLEMKGTIKITGPMYDLWTGMVDFVGQVHKAVWAQVEKTHNPVSPSVSGAKILLCRQWLYHALLPTAASEDAFVCSSGGRWPCS